MVDQSTFNQLGPESLDDTALTPLLKDMEHARELMAEGIDLNDAGLVRSIENDIPDVYW